jgi:hypothetical protein
MPKRKKRYVLYKTDEWNRPIYWQWFSVCRQYRVDWSKQTHFCVLFSDFDKWEAVYDTDAINTKLDNMDFVSGFESESLAIEHGRRKGWIKSVRGGKTDKLICYLT